MTSSGNARKSMDILFAEYGPERRPHRPDPVGGAAPWWKRPRLPGGGDTVPGLDHPHRGVW